MKHKQTKNIIAKWCHQHITSQRVTRSSNNFIILAFLSEASDCKNDIINSFWVEFARCSCCAGYLVSVYLCGDETMLLLLSCRWQCYIISTLGLDDHNIITFSHWHLVPTESLWKYMAIFEKTLSTLHDGVFQVFRRVTDIHTNNTIDSSRTCHSEKDGGISERPIFSSTLCP